LQCVVVCCSMSQCVAVCCSVLQCVAVCCSMFRCVAECCSVLQRVRGQRRSLPNPALHCNTPQLQHTVTPCKTLQHTATQKSHFPPPLTIILRDMQGNTLQHTATHCNTAKHCNTLQRTALHCNTRQHTATHCNAQTAALR